MKKTCHNNREKTLEILQLFVERVDKLRASSYVKDVSANGLKLTIGENMDSKFITFIHTSAAPEHVDAFLFTLRLFIHKKDSISIDRVSNLICSLDMEKKPRERFLEQQDYLNKFLNEKSMLIIDGN